MKLSTFHDVRLVIFMLSFVPVIFSAEFEESKWINSEFEPGRLPAQMTDFSRQIPSSSSVRTRRKKKYFASRLLPSSFISFNAVPSTFSFVKKPSDKLEYKILDAGGGYPYYANDHELTSGGKRGFINDVISEETGSFNDIRQQRFHYKQRNGMKIVDGGRDMQLHHDVDHRNISASRKSTNNSSVNSGAMDPLVADGVEERKEGKFKFMELLSTNRLASGRGVVVAICLGIIIVLTCVVAGLVWFATRRSSAARHRDAGEEKSFADDCLQIIIGPEDMKRIGEYNSDSSDPAFARNATVQSVPSLSETSSEDGSPPTPELTVTRPEIVKKTSTFTPTTSRAYRSKSGAEPLSFKPE